MSDTDPPRDVDGAEPTTAGDEGFQALVDTAREQEAEQERELTEAEKTKRRIMRERDTVDKTAPPIHLTVEGEEQDHKIAFSPMPQKVRVWVENSSFEFFGVDEETLTEDTARSQELRQIKDRTASLLAEYSRAAAFDAAFWHDYVGVEERMELIGAVLDRQDAREGNRR